jgi:two-component system LytT family sensor kinase
VTAAAALINLLGFLTGAALYAMLLAMVLNTPGPIAGSEEPKSAPLRDRLPLLTALFGLVWNLGALLVYGVYELRGESNTPPPLLVAAAFTALGFLPAVVVHSVLRTDAKLTARPAAALLTILAYGLSGVAGASHLIVALQSNLAPSHWALHLLTFGFGSLILVLLMATRRQGFWRRAGWGVALAVFAVSAQHLSHHEGGEYPLWLELIGHHASLPLAVAILYQDYRFALADLFLKRALSLVLLVAVAVGLYFALAGPFLERHFIEGRVDPIAIGALLGLWIVTALAFPALKRAVNWGIDSILLRRADYEALRAEIVEAIALKETPETVLDEVCRRLASALTAYEVRWAVADVVEKGVDSSIRFFPLIDQKRNSKWLKEPPPRRLTATVTAPTSESPRYKLLIGELSGGRRLFSDDLEMLETVAVLAARRIDAVRVAHERCLRDLHEQEIHKLASQAELRALRAQINPHFLFNALTTIGYLIQTAPERAGDTLMRLTTLLRSVLKGPEGEFTALGEEIELIEAYLDIERARFEDRLRVEIDVPDALRIIRLPVLLVQPLVENAIKHGIAPGRAGGMVKVEARLLKAESGSQGTGNRLRLLIEDTGVGASEIELARGRLRGVGLSNIEQRLRRHYGDEAVLKVRTERGAGATVELLLPINLTLGEAGIAEIFSGASDAPTAERRQA